MKTFVAVLVMLALATTQVSAQKRKADVYVTDDKVSISISLNTKTQNTLFESETKWVVVGCAQSRDMSISVNMAEAVARRQMIRGLVFLVHDTTMLERIKGKPAWQVKPMREKLERVDLDLESSHTAKRFIREEGVGYEACVAMVASKSVMTREKIRQNGQLLLQR